MGRAVVVLDVLLRVVCFVDHPLLTVSAGEVLVDHYSRDGGARPIASTPAGSVGPYGTPSGQSSSSVSGVMTVQDDVLKSELVLALSSIAVLSNQVLMLWNH